MEVPDALLKASTVLLPDAILGIFVRCIYERTWSLPMLRTYAVYQMQVDRQIQRRALGHGFPIRN